MNKQTELPFNFVFMEEAQQQRKAIPSTYTNPPSLLFMNRNEQPKVARYLRKTFSQIEVLGEKNLLKYRIFLKSE